VQRWPAIGAQRFVEERGAAPYRPPQRRPSDAAHWEATMPITPRCLETVRRRRARRDGAHRSAPSAQAQNAPIMMDGHVHIINRVYWEGIDAWQEQPGIGWDYARARKAGVNCVIDNIGTYGAWNYNYSPKQALR
jgi:hypothetical protein